MEFNKKLRRFVLMHVENNRNITGEQFYGYGKEDDAEEFAEDIYKVSSEPFL